MKKTVTSKKVEALTDQVKQAVPSGPRKLTVADKKKYDFPVGSSFMLDGHQYTVRKAYFEMNCDMRKLYTEGNEQVETLVSLRKAAIEDDEFMVV